VEVGSNVSAVAVRVAGDDEGEVSNLSLWSVVAGPSGLGPESDCAGEGR
jgi:hypothetical protein